MSQGFLDTVTVQKQVADFLVQVTGLRQKYASFSGIFKLHMPLIPTIDN
jgi:hypothetical protein